MSKKAKVERIDHLGIVAGVIQDLGIINKIDERIATDRRESITTGEAIAGMIVNGLGFSDCPLSLTPQFFENKPLDQLFRSGMLAEHFNRFKLGRALDDCHDYGCDLLFSELSMDTCREEGVDTRFNALDTTAFSLTGEYDTESDEHTIAITHGHSKDHRPDLKQAVLELICSHDGGVPVISKSWDGNASDTKVFRERAQALVKSLKEGESPRYVIADAKLYNQETVNNHLKFLFFITRIPRGLNQAKIFVSKALQSPIEEWEKADARNRFLSFTTEHYGVKERWIVVCSEEAKKRSAHMAEKKCEKEKVAIDKKLKKLSQQEYTCRQDAEKALKMLGKTWKYHKVLSQEIREKKRYSGKGRPSATVSHQVGYQVFGTCIVDEKKRTEIFRQGSCFIVGTNIPIEEMSSAEILNGYKKQNETVERGFRFLKDPYLFTSSLFVKKPARIMALLMVMTLSLLVYAIAQRRLRAALKAAEGTLPNQIKKPTKTPTLRWIFQLLSGIERVTLHIEGHIQELMTGISAFRARILSYFGATVRKIYKINCESAPTF
ncbi:MAG: IS1634 family transposase [Chlamydiota bacterium]